MASIQPARPMTQDPQSQSLTESEVLIRDFLAANPSLDSELGNVETMTDRYTNAEWSVQIEETKRRVLEEIGKQDGKEASGKRYTAPKPGSGEFAATIDHTVLKLDATSQQIDALCAEARTEGFKSVCVRLNWVSRCVSNLEGSPVVVACVVGFHEGTQDTHSKLREARAAVAAGAAELDVVLNHGILTRHSPGKTQDDDSGDAQTPEYSLLYRELATLRSLTPPPVVLKLILETSQLAPDQILAAAHLAAAANFDFIKTSTGFNGPGANLPDVRLMVAASEYLSRAAGGRTMQVKASGGVRSLDDALAMLEAGATRLGTSGGLLIMRQCRERAATESEDGRPAATGLADADESVGGY